LRTGITDDVFATLSEKLSTPLQFEYYLTRALEEAYKVGQKACPRPDPGVAE